MKKICIIVFAILLTVSSTSLIEKAPLPEEKPLTVEEQRDRAFEVFNEILDISVSSSDRIQVLPEMEKKIPRDNRKVSCG